MPYTFLFVSSEESVTRRSLMKRHVLDLLLLQRKDPCAEGGDLRRLAMTRVCHVGRFIGSMIREEEKGMLIGITAKNEEC